MCFLCSQQTHVETDLLGDRPIKPFMNGWKVNIDEIDLSNTALDADTPKINLLGYADDSFIDGGPSLEEGGIRFLVDLLARLEQQEDGFDRDRLNEPEFLEFLGESINDADYLNSLYGGLLGYEADENGFQFWMEAMEQGLERADLLFYFIEASREAAPSDGLFLA